MGHPSGISASIDGRRKFPSTAPTERATQVGQALRSHPKSDRLQKLAPLTKRTNILSAYVQSWLQRFLAHVSAAPGCGDGLGGPVRLCYLTEPEIPHHIQHYRVSPGQGLQFRPHQIGVEIFRSRLNLAVSDRGGVTQPGEQIDLLLGGQPSPFRVERIPAQ